MGTLVIKNLPDTLHAKLKAQAQANRRSVTKEAIMLLKQGLVAPHRQAPKLPPLPPPLKLKGGPITIQEIEAAIADGRD